MFLILIAFFVLLCPSIVHACDPPYITFEEALEVIKKEHQELPEEEQKQLAQAHKEKLWEDGLKMCSEWAEKQERNKSWWNKMLTLIP